MNNKLLSWGNYPFNPQTPHAIYWPDQVRTSLTSISEIHGIDTTLAYGMGRSYGDSCLANSNHVLSMCGMDRVLTADWATGIITVQAGMTLDALIRIALPQGWFLPVTPGTRFITVGGAIANDVHGKNHHAKGTFGRHVRRLSIYRSDEGLVECSPTLRPDLFTATIAGLGLTGIILTAEIQLRPVMSSQIDQNSIRFDNLDEFFGISHQYDSQHEYSVAWIDCLASGSSTGRGIYMGGDHAKEGSLEVASNSKLTVPFNPPVSLINSFTLRAFNTLYYHHQRHKIINNRISYAPFFYPLDGILHWNRIYGKAGFQQYQCVIPNHESREAIRTIMQEIARSKAGSFLAVLKQAGNIPSPGLLSFPIPGVTLALDFPQHEPENTLLFEKLDKLVHEAGGRLYPAKDAHMSSSHFQTAYPNWKQLEAIRDPMLLSQFWKRVTQ